MQFGFFFGILRISCVYITERKNGRFSSCTKKDDMKSHSFPSDNEITEIYNRQADFLYRVCFNLTHNHADAEDAVQETFIRLIRSRPVFENAAHERAWLLKTGERICLSMLRSKWRKHEDIEAYYELGSSGDTQSWEIFTAVMALPVKYRTVIYLYYYEGYSGKEIAEMLKKPASTIRNYLSEARKVLKKELGEDIDEN